MPCLILNLSARSLSGIVGLQKKYVDPNPSLSSKLIPNFSKDISILPSGNFTRNQKLACYALYLKIINPFFCCKIAYTSYCKLYKKLENSIKI